MGRACGLSREGWRKARVASLTVFWFFLILVPATELGTGSEMLQPLGSLESCPSEGIGFPMTWTHQAFGCEKP